MTETVANDVEVKAPSKKSKAAAAEKSAAFEMPKLEMPKFEMPKLDFPKVDFAKLPQIEVPPVFREVAEKSVAQAKANYEKIKTAAEEATDVLEDTYETARAGMVEYNVKALEAVKANADATFGFAKDFAGVKTFAEAVELQTSFVRKQFEMMSAQAKELQAVATKVATETAKPTKDAITKTMKDLKVA